MTKNNKCKSCDLLGTAGGCNNNKNNNNNGGEAKGCQLEALQQPLDLTANNQVEILGGLYLQQLKDIMLAAYLLKGYYQPAGPLIQHPPPLPPVKGPPPESTPTPPQNSEGSDDLVATSTTSGTSSTGGGFYRAYCPQYYATPPQYQELCYPPAYAHSHQHPPPYYHKYAAPPYRRQYYGYQEAGGPPNAGPGGASGAGPGVVEYQAPPGEYLPPYYGGYPAAPPAPAPPPSANPAYMSGRAPPAAFVDHHHAGFQSCPCPMQSCPKNGDTGPLIGNGKGAPVATGPGLSLPPSALVGPPSPARGLAGLAPPHGANAWDTDRVQLNPAHRSHHKHQQQQQQQQQQQSDQPQAASSSQQQQQQQTAGRSVQALDCIAKGDNEATNNCICAAKRTADSTSAGCEVKVEQSTSPPTSSTDKSQHLHNHHHHHHHHHHQLKLENNNVKCESCNVSVNEATSSEDATTAPPTTSVVVVASATTDSAEDEVTRVKCESESPPATVKCEQLLKCEQFSDNTIDPVAGERKHINHRHSLPVCPIRTSTGRFKKVRVQKPHYEAAAEQVSEKEPSIELTIVDKTEEAKVVVNGGGGGGDVTDAVVCPATIDDSSVTTEAAVAAALASKRKLSLDSHDAPSIGKSKKINKRTLSMGSPEESTDVTTPIANGVDENPDDANDDDSAAKETPNNTKKKATNKENQKRKSDAANPNEPLPKKSKSAPIKVMASENSIMETINNVIQQSLQMTQKGSKNKVFKANNKVEKNNKKNAAKLLTTLKKAPKNLIHTVSVIKNEFKNSQLKITNKLEAKLKKVQNAKRKSNKVKAKLLAEVKTKVLEVKNMNNKLPDLKNKFMENKINKVIELKNNNILETKNNKILESKSLNKLVEAKNSKNKVQDLKDVKEDKDNKGVNETKSNNITTIPAVKSLKAKKPKDCVKNGKLPDSSKGKKKGKAGKKMVVKKEFSLKAKDHELVSKSIMVPRKPFLKPKWCNGWSWEGEPFEAKVYLTNEESAIRKCYPCMRHTSGDILRPLDCVLLRSGQKKADLPFVAKIAALWENPDDGEMMFSLLWYYRPEHTEQGRTEYDTDDEVFASRHRDANSVATIEDKCYILTFNEYCRYRKNIRRIDEGLDGSNLTVPPGDQQYPRESRQPPIPVPPDMVLFCRRVYDYRGKKLVKNPG